MTDPLGQLRAHFTGLRLRERMPVGDVYAGQDGTGAEVVVAVLTGASATDQGVRDAFADVVWRHSIGGATGRPTVTSADLHAALPWAATRVLPGKAGAEQLLAGIAAPGAAGLEPSAPTVGQRVGTLTAPTTVIHAEPAPPGPAARPRGQVSSWVARVNRPGSPWPWLFGAAGGVLLVLVATTLFAIGQALPPGDPGRPGDPATGPPVAGSPGPTGADQDLPELRAVEPVGIVGPTFGEGEPSETMALVGWPFAFRVPAGWQCHEEHLDEIPSGDYYQCHDDPEEPEQLVAVMLWVCPTTCTDAEQEEMLTTWLDEPEVAVRLDPAPTAYVETGRNRDGNYSVDLVHFAAAEPGGPLRWLVAVYIESPVPSRADVQKVLNDIIGQSSH